MNLFEAMTPTEPGERKVCGAMVARVNGDPLLCEMECGHDGAHSARLAGPVAANGAVILPLSLAQRILAALEDPGLRQTYGFVTNALAAELRARLPP